MFMEMLNENRKRLKKGKYVVYSTNETGQDIKVSYGRSTWFPEGHRCLSRKKKRESRGGQRERLLRAVAGVQDDELSTVASSRRIDGASRRADSTILSSSFSTTSTSRDCAVITAACGRKHVGTCGREVLPYPSQPSSLHSSLSFSLCPLSFSLCSLQLRRVP